MNHNARRVIYRQEVPKLITSLYFKHFGHQAYRSIGKIRVCLMASSIPVAVKHRAVDPVYTVKIFLVLHKTCQKLSI
jgi:hypothetical protein